MGKKSPKHRKETESPDAEKARKKHGVHEDHEERARFGMWGTLILFIFTIASAIFINYYTCPVTFQMFVYWQLIIWVGMGAGTLWFHFLYRDHGDVYRNSLIVMALYLVISIPAVLVGHYV